MSLLDKINFTIPSFTSTSAWKWLTKSPKSVVGDVGGYLQMFRFGYYYASWTGNQTCFSRQFGASDLLMQRVKEILGVKSFSLPVAKAAVSIDDGCFEVIDRPYSKIYGKSKERVLPISEKEMKRLDKKMADKPIDVDRDGTPEIAGSLFRIDLDNKPEEFHLHYNDPEKKVVTETLLKIPTGYKLKTSFEIYIIPSASPDKTIKVTLPLSIRIYTDI